MTVLIDENKTDTETTTDNPRALDNASPYLAYEPSRLANHIRDRQKALKDAKKGYYDFSHLVSEMNMTNFDDCFEMRAMLESQAHILGVAFQYLMIQGDWKNLAHILKTQKVMHDTMELMQKFPPLIHDDRYYSPATAERMVRKDVDNATPLD